MKFPDLIHAVKPEPHNGMPQAGSAHDTFWDFVSLSPEAMHTLMWVMSDRGIPRSYRMMQGFGVHTFRLVNAGGASHFVKFHRKPMLGTHSLVWDEATKIQGADSDFHRRDLWDAIEAGEFPEWELGFQIFTEEQAEQFSFDVLDATKLIPEELVPVLPVGRMTLNRNPDNFFAETEQVAFCVAHVIPGIDFSNDPLLSGRIHSYIDTQISRLGGANFHEIPVNTPLSPVNNNQRDGMHRQTIHKGRVAYEPNSLAGGCPFQSGQTGFVSFPQHIEGDKVRGKPEKFSEHYAQATLFWNSQTRWEQEHIAGGFRFELSKLTVPQIQDRALAMLVNVSPDLAAAVASGLGVEVPVGLQRASPFNVDPEVSYSPSLSLLALPGECGVRTRKVAILIAQGADLGSLRTLQAQLVEEGVKPVFVAGQLGAVCDVAGDAIEPTATLENSAGVLFDALILPDGDAAVNALAAEPQTHDFVAGQYRHGKAILALGASSRLLRNIGLDRNMQSSAKPEGVFEFSVDDISEVGRQFILALRKHRYPQRPALYGQLFSA